jgi:lysozyme family protein
MASHNFDRSMARILAHEGGYVDHPQDPGGATNLGVTMAVLAASRGHAVTKQDVRNLTRAEALAIYRAQYWNAVHADKLAVGLDYCQADFGVNSGAGRANRFLQTELKAMGLYKGAIDGQLGALTFDALRQVNDVDALIGRLCDRRLAFLKKLKGWSTFGKGWGRRVAEVRSIAQGWAHGGALADVPLPEPVAPVRGKASQVAVTKTGEGKAGIGTTLGLLGSTASEAAEQLAPYSDTLTVLKYVFVALTLVSVGVGLYLTISKLNNPQPEAA